MNKLYYALLLILLVCSGAPVHAHQALYIAAASDLAYCIDELSAAFTASTPGAQVKLTLGASGNFMAQIKAGAPFDVFMSADLRYPARLAMDGAADAATLTPYAIGRIVVWSIDPRFDLASGMRVFADPRAARIAIANPDIAPYGQAARAALQLHGMWDGVQSRLVLGENLAQTVQFVQSGNAQLGVVSLASVLSPRLRSVGTYYLIPEAGLAPLEQGAIITNKGRGNALAARFMQFLRSKAARTILARNGFGLPALTEVPGDA